MQQMITTIQLEKGLLCILLSTFRVLHLVCTHQFMAMKRINKQNAQGRKDFASSAESASGKYIKLEYPSLCRGYIKAHPLTKTMMKENMMESVHDHYTTEEAVIINEVCAHSCTGHPQWLLEVGVLPTVTTIWPVLRLNLLTQIPTLNQN
jgi:hypothetical protein